MALIDIGSPYVLLITVLARSFTVPTARVFLVKDLLIEDEVELTVEDGGEVLYL